MVARESILMITTGAIGKAAMLKKMQLANKFIVPGFKYAKRVAKAQEIALSAVHGAAVSHNVASATSLILAQKPLTTRQRVSALVGGTIGGGTGAFVRHWMAASFISGVVTSPLGQWIEDGNVDMYEWGSDVLLNVSFATVAVGYPKSAMPRLSKRLKSLTRKNKLNDLLMKKYMEYKKQFERWVWKEEIAIPLAIGVSQGLGDEFITPRRTREFLAPIQYKLRKDANEAEIRWEKELERYPYEMVLP